MKMRRMRVQALHSAAPSAKNVSALNSMVCDTASQNRLVPAGSLRNVNRRSPRLIKSKIARTYGEPIWSVMG